MSGKNRHDETWANLSACQAELAQLREENSLLVSQVGRFREIISKLEEENAQLKKNFFDFCDDCIANK